jgi:two-component system cell cycle sensor histidine kinase/response regulator CckA
MPTILVVDDEAPIRQLVQRVLERRGYRVITCESASEALAQTGPFDLLLVDLILPEANGRQLADSLRKRWPTLPVVMMSGYLSERELMPAPPSSFMQKPMLPGTIVSEVEKMLGDASEQSDPPQHG